MTTVIDHWKSWDKQKRVLVAVSAGLTAMYIVLYSLGQVIHYIKYEQFTCSTLGGDVGGSLLSIPVCMLIGFPLWFILVIVPAIFISLIVLSFIDRGVTITEKRKTKK